MPAVIRCKACGAPLEFAPGEKVCICKCCQSPNTLVIPDNVEISNKANELRNRCEFDRAIRYYEDLFAMEKLRILFTGDSITDVNRTDMVRMTEEWMSRDPNATPQQREEAVNRALGCGYPLLVASQLGAQEPGRYEFLNRGISGNRVVDLDARIKRDCINLRPDVISILIGVNDVWHELGEHNGVDAPKFRRVYEGMLQEITHALPGVKLILLEPYVLQGPATLENWDTFRQEVDLRREVVRDLAKSYWEKQDLYIPCIDTQKLFDEAAARSCPGVWSADGVHPTPAGHWLLAQEWLRCFKEL